MVAEAALYRVRFHIQRLIYLLSLPINDGRRRDSSRLHAELRGVD